MDCGYFYFILSEVETLDHQPLQPLSPAIEAYGYSTRTDDYLGIQQHYDPAAKLHTSQLRTRAALIDDWLENVTAARLLGMSDIRLATFRVSLNLCRFSRHSGQLWL
jgi:hypothetical protein